MKRHLPLYTLILIAFFSVGFQARGWLEDMVLEHDIAIATHGAIFTKQYEAIRPETEIAELPTQTLEPFPTSTPTVTRTLAATNTPSPTRSATSTQPLPPTQEVAVTETSTVSAPVQTVIPTLRPDASCFSDADFEAFSTVRRRSSPVAVDLSNVYPEAVTKYRTENVCLSTRHMDAQGYEWIQIGDPLKPRVEWVALSRTVNGATDYYGTLSIWGATATPSPTSTPAPVSLLSPFTVSGNSVLLNGQPFKYVGTNFRELIGYDNVIMPYASNGDIVTQIDGAKGLGMRVIRFYISHRNLTVDQAIPRVRYILDLLKDRDMYAILVISDGVHSGFNVAETPGNRTTSGLDRYTHEFYGGGFRQNYLPYVEKMTKAIGAHPAIFAWEPINEATTVQIPPTTQQMNDFLTFYSETAAVIRRNSPGKLISSGLESCWQLFVLNAYDGQQYCERLYDIVDVGTIHTYQANNGQALGSSYMHFLREMELQQPLIIEEVSGLPEVESTDWLNLLVKASFNRMTGLMHWNMSFPYCRDIGVGDGAWNACAGSAQARRWYHLTGFLRVLADQLRLMY